MDNRYIKDEIKRSVSVKQAIARYAGVEVGNKNIKCLFHNDSKPSMGVKDEYYKCFSCGAGGDVISFVMNYCGVGFNEAIVMLDNDFVLGLTGKRVSVSQQIAMRKRQKEKEEAEHKKAKTDAEYTDLCQEYRICDLALKSGALEPMSEMWCYYNNKKAELEIKMSLGGYL